MLRYLVVSFVLSIGACGSDSTLSQNDLKVRTAQVKIVGGSESAFVAQHGDALTKQAPGLYSLADANGRYQVAFGIEGAVAGLQLAQNDQANMAKWSMQQETALLISKEETLQAVTFWKQAVDSQSSDSAKSDVLGITVSRVAGDCTVVATATVNPYSTCYAAATAEYNGIVGPRPWGAVSASAGADSHSDYGSRVSVGAFDPGPCSRAFAAASICGISVTALPW